MPAANYSIPANARAVIPAQAGISYPFEARKRRIPPLPIRGEDAANAAGEGIADAARGGRGAMG